MDYYVLLYLTTLVLFREEDGVEVTSIPPNCRSRVQTPTALDISHYLHHPSAVSVESFYCGPSLLEFYLIPFLALSCSLSFYKSAF